MNVSRAELRRPWFALVWLWYLLFPVTKWFSVPSPLWMTLTACALLGLFVLLFAKVFMLLDGHPVRPLWNLSAVLYCFALTGLSLPILGGTSVTFLIYGISFAAFQRSAWAAGTLTALSYAGMGLLWASGHLEWGDVLAFGVMAAGAGAANFFSFRSAEQRVLEHERQKEKEHLAQLAERERIGRDLHDLLGHTLSVIVLKSELAAKLSEKDPQRAAQEIREVERISREALSEVRQAVRGYRGSGLMAELGRAKVALDTAGVALEYVGERLELPQACERTLELVLREAVTNVVRHARAKSCRIALERVRGGLRLDISDDGVGLTGREGSGLTAMRERLRALGGTLEVASGAGTRLSAHIPLVGAETGALEGQIVRA